MRRKLSAEDKRGSLIGIKVRRDIKAKIAFISEREAHPMSTQINLILENYIQQYFTDNQINWEEYAPRYEKEGREESEDT